MRAGVGCALALTLLAVTSALRTAQVEGASRISRRPPLHTSTEESPGLQQIEEVSTQRTRGLRRREETTPRHVVQSRTRTRPTEVETVTESEAKAKNGSNERSDSRKTYSRTRNRPEVDLDSPKANVIRSRTRFYRPAPTPSAITTKTPEVSSPTIDESKIEVINSTLDEIPKMVFNEDEPSTTQFRRKSSTTQVTETVVPRRRGRINIRTYERSDLVSSGTTNSISMSEKGPTTDKMVDLRNSRKLRYKPRLSETDSNLTGLGITSSSTIAQSSQKEISPSQETLPSVPISVGKVQQNTETNLLNTTTLKVMRTVRRKPISRGKGNLKPSSPESHPKKRSDEVSEDDNYPEPFKALLQAKNASTQTSSPTGESLSVKASEKVYKTYTPPRKTPTFSSGGYTYSPLRRKLNGQSASNREEKLVESTTYTTPQQTPLISPGGYTHSPMRRKINVYKKSRSQENPVEITEAPKISSTRQPNHKFRSSYTTASRKFSPSTTTTRSVNTFDESSQKSIYKFNRKFKASTTEVPKSELKVSSKRVDTNNLLKTTLNRPSYYSQRNSSKIGVNNPVSNIENNIDIEDAIESIAKHKATLPRTSYYTRQRNSQIITTATEEPLRANNSVFDTANRKNGDSADMPLIFTLLKTSDIIQSEDDKELTNTNLTEKAHKMFVIAVTSKETQETSTENEIMSNTVEESEAKPVEAIEVFPTAKYHATYSVPQPTAVEEDKEIKTSSSLPAIKNIQTRKFGRGRTNSRSRNGESSNSTVERDRGSGKFTDSFSKTTEASTNGINPETEKSKHRFSSKYRASFLEKPFYRPTVPTVTPSTAWLKFFVTDRLLTKYVEEPNWFEEDYNDVTTPMSRLNITPHITHESSIELIEGEEFQLGPGMNAISFTQTRSPAELLKLSESLVKPSHVMNVEASQHSQSVTVSIFDALAEILTSTPRNRLSSTTEVLQKQKINTDSIQALNGVSNNINVNSRILSSQDTLSLNINVNTTNVQNTDQIPNVNNPPVAVGATPAPTTLQASPIPTPTTPVSARRPFAFKVLYSDTEPTDKLSTAPEPTSNQPSTDNPTMISTSALNLKDSSNGVTAVANKPPAEQSTASHVLSLRTTTMLPSVDEILLNSLSSAAKEEMVVSSMTSSTRQPTILTLDIDPETKQIRTEKPGEGNDSAVFKFIPIAEVTVRSQNTNVLKLASSKSLTTTETSQTQGITETVTESNTQTPQIPALIQTDDPTTTVQVTAGTTIDASTELATMPNLLTTSSTEANTTPLIITEMPTTVMTTTIAPATTTTEAATTTVSTTQAVVTTTEATTTTVTATTSAPTTQAETTTLPSSTAGATSIDEVTKEETMRYHEDAELLKAFLDGTERIPETMNLMNLDQSTGTSTLNTKTTSPMTTQQSDEDKFLQVLLSSAGKNSNTVTIPNIRGNIKVTSGIQTTTTRSIEDDIRQFEEDTKLLKALLQATGQNPAKFNIPTLDIRTTPIPSTTETMTTAKPTKNVTPQTTTPSIDPKTKQLEENAKLLQALLQATGQSNGNFNVPVISGITSNVRIASNPYTTSLGSSPTTPINIRPIYTTLNTSPKPRTTTLPPSTVIAPTTLQPRDADFTTIRISTTFPPFNRQRKQPTTATATESTTVPTARRVPSSRFSVTTEISTSSTFSVEEDLAFLKNLKSVLNTNTNTADPEAALANRIIALAVDRSLSEIKTGKVAERTGKNIVATTTTSTTTTTTTTPRPTTAIPSTPSIEDDIRQFQEDTKLLQALLKATGQDPSKLNLPTLPDFNIKVSSKLPAGINNDLNLLSNLLASPSPLNEPFDSLTQKPKEQLRPTAPAATRPFGAKIAVKDDLKNEQDDEKLLQTLIQLQGVQETTTLKSKIAVTGQSTDEALKKLIQQTKPTGMVPEATKTPLAISTEYGKSNDALLAALLKEQGFGPTTASSLDEQLRLAALLNQVVVTPKARRTTTPPPPPAPRRPILDGLAWLWQQWRDTGPATGAKRPNRRPEPAPTASVSASQATSNRVNWFGSGPFVGNADDRPTSNRIPLEPPRAVTSEQTPGRGQLVSAAINVTRAFSQFLGAAIQGAAQTVQNVIRAGQRAATDVYSNGSGASG